jgi:hypothetical protein
MLYLADSVSPRKATRSLIERGIFTEGEFLEMVKVDREMKRKTKV